MQLSNTVSVTGDMCHRDILNINDNDAGRYVKANMRPPSIFMCCDGNEKQLTVEEYQDLKNNLC